jgi:hypothetical protein
MRARFAAGLRGCAISGDVIFEEHAESAISFTGEFRLVKWT